MARTKQLPVTVPLHPDEATVSYCSRLAAANGARTMREFYRHVGIQQLAFDRGADGPLERLATVGGVDVNELKRRIARQAGPYARQLNGQIIPRYLARKPGKIFVCPQCLVDDLANGSGPAAIRPYVRVSWLTFVVTICPAHGVPIRCFGDDVGSTLANDIVTLVKLKSSMLASGCRDTHPHREVDKYMDARIQGELPSDNVFLSTLSLEDAFRFAEVIGMTILFPHAVTSSSLTETQRWTARQRGYEVTKLGNQGFCDYLSFLSDRHLQLDSVFNARAAYGLLVQWLRGDHRTEFSDLKRIIQEHALENLPVGPNDHLLGRFSERRMHSIKTAVAQYRIPPDTLRNHLLKTGLVSATADRPKDDKVVFRATAAVSHLEALSTRRWCKRKQKKNIERIQGLV